MTTVRQTVQYAGDSDAERQAAFLADLPVKTASGWVPVEEVTQRPFGEYAQFLVVTYEHEAEAASKDESEPIDQGVGTDEASLAEAPPDMPAGGPAPPVAGFPPYPQRYPWPQRYPYQPSAEYPGPYPHATAWPLAPQPSLDERLANEPPAMRYLRRSMVFGGLLLLIVVPLMYGYPPQPDPPEPYAYGEYGILCILEGVICAGLAWYLLRWRRVPLAVRIVGVAILGAFVLGAFFTGGQYLMGIPPEP